MEVKSNLLGISTPCSLALAACSIAACRALRSSSVSGMVTELLVRDQLQRSIGFFSFFNACFPVFHCSGALLGWIDVLNKWMSSLDTQTCVGMAPVKKNLWHFPKSKMAAGVVYCYRSPFPFESFPWSILEGSRLFLRVPWSPYRSRRGHNEVYSSLVVHGKRTFIASL